MMPFDCYKKFLAIKNHFTKEKYDYHKYCGSSRASLNSFYKRKDRYFFEKLSRQKNDKEIEEFFVANFATCNDPQSLYIVELMREGDKVHRQWQKKIQSLSYSFKNEIEEVFLDRDFDRMFSRDDSYHPPILKAHLQGKLSLETMLILNKILGYKSHFDRKIDDPVWKLVSLKLSKYDKFLNIDVFHYRKILKDVLVEDQ
jgi:hypothetical protein